MDAFEKEILLGSIMEEGIFITSWSSMREGGKSKGSLWNQGICLTLQQIAYLLMNLADVV